MCDAAMTGIVAKLTSYSKIILILMTFDMGIVSDGNQGTLVLPT